MELRAHAQPWAGLHLSRSYEPSRGERVWYLYFNANRGHFSQSYVLRWGERVRHLYLK